MTDVCTEQPTAAAATAIGHLKDKIEDGHRHPASTWMPLPPRRPTVTLTFDLQNLIMPSKGG